MKYRENKFLIFLIISIIYEISYIRTTMLKAQQKIFWIHASSKYEKPLIISFTGWFTLVKILKKIKHIQDVKKIYFA